MPYPAGINGFDLITDADALPPHEWHNVEWLTDHHTGQRIPARRAKDGTLWCAACDTTITPSPAARFCNEHAREHKALLDERRRGPEPMTVTVPAYVIKDLMDLKDRLHGAMSDALVHIHRLRREGDRPDPWMTQFTVASKDLDIIVEDQIGNALHIARERARRRAPQAAPPTTTSGPSVRARRSSSARRAGVVSQS